eukprot:gene19161-21081_t
MFFRAAYLTRLSNVTKARNALCCSQVVKHLGPIAAVTCSSNANLILKRQLHEDFKLVYEGPLSRTVKYVKTFSLATCVASVLGCPVLVMFGKESVPFVGKIALAATVLMMGTTTTFILHWFTRVYVHRMFYNPHENTFAVETMNLLAQKKMTHIPVEHVEYPISEKAFCTFKAGGKDYFLHMELREAELVMNYVKERNLTELGKAQ